MNFQQKYPIGTLFLDALFATLLAVVGLSIAGVIQESVTPSARWMYPIWGTIGMVPVLCYMQLRGVGNFDKWDALFALPIPIVLAVVVYFYGDQYIMFVMMLLIFLSRWAKDWLMPSAVQEQ
ncbi:hypothetical protein C5Y96_10730 [Blastopirellula marina]|uniref:Uncharacterized protein n=2 Tax=Pirellulales TaxID=2691354 RepID=A0A2S8FM83_9BACT|nr:hypothetical protein C5Y96_10730 [Blastopirellula marina]RCS52407.1 hypothetical protein DTL36_10740 [Bremerella cremea]